MDGAPMMILVEILGIGLIVSVACVAVLWLIARKLLREPESYFVTIATGTTWSAHDY